MIDFYDIHCHYVPGVDDGSSSMEESLELLRMEYEDGVRHIIITPHYRRQMFETSREKVKERFAELRRQALSQFPDLVLYLGCEYHVNMEMTEQVGAEPAYRMAGSRYVLAEFSEYRDDDYMTERLRRLVQKGYTPIIAHAERIAFVRSHMDYLYYLRDNGIYVQANADSILGMEGMELKRFCKKLMKADLLDFVGSDAHDVKSRPPHMGKCADYIEKKMGADYARRILKENPAEIIAHIK